MCAGGGSFVFKNNSKDVKKREVLVCGGGGGCANSKDGDHGSLTENGTDGQGGRKGGVNGEDAG